MKKALVLAVLVCLVSAGAFALDLSVGAKLGGSMILGDSEHDPGDLNDDDGLKGGLLGFGITGGVAVELGFTPLFSVEADILYAGMFNYGYYAEVPGLYSGKNKTKFSALEIPVLAKASFGGFFVDAGPSLIIPVSKLKNDSPAPPPFGGESESDADVALGITGGLGYGFDVGKGEMTVELRFTRSLTGIHDDVDGGTGKTNYNRLDLMAGYSFGL